MSKMENFIAVQENTAGIIGKFLYYSTSNILINRAKFIEIASLSDCRNTSRPENPKLVLTATPLPQSRIASR